MPSIPTPDLSLGEVMIGVVIVLWVLGWIYQEKHPLENDTQIGILRKDRST